MKILKTTGGVFLLVAPIRDQIPMLHPMLVIGDALH
jgi:hypothetical protein